LPYKQLPLRLLWYYLGLCIMTFGYALVILPGIGAGPWDIFHFGAAGQTGLALSLVIQLIGACLIVLNYTLGIRPTLGMVLNMLSVGPILQQLMPLIPVPASLPGRWGMMAAGVLVAGLGTAMYVSADLGSGPRDGLMIGLTRKLGIPIGFVKNGIDVAVAAVGWWMGGPLGLGTVAVALCMGPSVQLGMTAVRRLATYAPFDGFVRPVSLKRS